jgi:hypothetical protein
MSANDKWLQIFSSGSRGTTSEFRIEWQFNDCKTLEERFDAAFSSGQAVTWTVTDTANSGVPCIIPGGVWWWSTDSLRWPNDLSGAGFSNDDRLWGAGSYVDSNGLCPGYSYFPPNFWGMGNTNAGEQLWLLSWQFWSIFQWLQMLDPRWGGHGYR